MKYEYLILAGLAGWLIRGCWEVYRHRKDIAVKDIPKVVILGGGGPRPK